ncbi:MAG: type II toxin-antitoxin system RelE/ParE family toxin [Clostridiaceae bacterium]|nr:type II toxin-antitoxin system RelE/ParE family toxin [Clostridiaceae bacterium]
MPEFRIVLTWEAIYDLTDIADYIEDEFGISRADYFQKEIKKELEMLTVLREAFPKTQIMYRGYVIHKKPFPPSIVFYVIDDQTKEIHILRVLREERDWKRIMSNQHEYSYPD